MKIATWNINAGIKLRNLKPKEYTDTPDIGYYIDNIQSVDPDILCLQEVHINDNNSQVKIIANQLGYDHFTEHIFHPFHTDQNFQVGNAVLSKTEFKNVRNIILPYPTFDLQRIDGKETIRHDKNLQIVDFDNFTLGNVHLQALHFLGSDYDTEQGIAFAKEIESVLLKELTQPLLLCGDFNFTDIEQTYNELFSTFDLDDAMKGMVTIPHKELTPDHICFSKNDFNHLNSKVTDVMSDHKLCMAEIEPS